MMIFEDAWLEPHSLSTGLVEDVMTPLRPGYYQGAAAPTDCLGPIPVPFLTVHGDFQFVIRPENPNDAEGRKWAEAAMKLCVQALGTWGIGGKTRAGYGRMRPAPKQNTGRSRPLTDSSFSCAYRQHGNGHLQVPR